MFHFFGQSMCLEDIELRGQLHTSLSGTWVVQDLAKGNELHEEPNLMSQLTDFITHTKGSSFPLPHPDEDLRKINLRGYGITHGLFWVNNFKRNGSIRLLLRERDKTSVFKGYLNWKQPRFGNLPVENGVELGASQDNPEEFVANLEDEVVVEIQDIVAQASAFE